MEEKKNPNDEVVETLDLNALIQSLADRVHKSRNAPDLDQTIEQLGAAITLYEALMPQGVPSDGLHHMFELVSDARDRELEGPAGRRDGHLKTQTKVIIIAAVRYFADGSRKNNDVSQARKRVAKILGLEPSAVKRIETQWARRQSRGQDGALPVSRGTLVPDLSVGAALKMIHNAVSQGVQPDEFIREFCSE